MYTIEPASGGTTTTQPILGGVTRRGVHPDPPAATTTAYG